MHFDSREPEKTKGIHRSGSRSVAYTSEQSSGSRCWTRPYVHEKNAKNESGAARTFIAVEVACGCRDIRPLRSSANEMLGKP